MVDAISALEQLGAKITRVDFDVLKVDFSFAEITDDDLMHLAGLKDQGTFEFLYLDNTEITDAGLVHLKSLKWVTSLSLKGTFVTDDGEEELQQALPNCSIYR